MTRSFGGSTPQQQQDFPHDRLLQQQNSPQHNQRFGLHIPRHNRIERQTKHTNVSPATSKVNGTSLSFKYVLSTVTAFPPKGNSCRSCSQGATSSIPSSTRRLVCLALANPAAGNPTPGTSPRIAELRTFRQRNPRSSDPHSDRSTARLACLTHT